MNSALAHGGLPEGVKPYQLIALVKQVSRSTAKFDRISRTAVSLLEYCISCCRDGDFHRGKICGAWEQPRTIAVKLGISTRVLHNAEAELREKNLIERTSVAHARRQGLRRNGEIVSLAGISLRPLIDGYGKLVAIRDAMQMQQDAVSSLKNEICQLRRRIRETGDVHLAEEADEILPGGRTSRITQTDRLEAIKGELEALLVFIDVRSCEHKSSDRTEENFAPIVLEEASFKNRSGVGRGAPIETALVTPVMAANLASEDYQALLAARGGPSWPNLVETSATASSWLGISQQVWGEACQTMGREDLGHRDRAGPAQNSRKDARIPRRSGHGLRHVSAIPMPTCEHVANPPCEGTDMTTIAIISQKGGAGKTTLAIHLAATAYRHGHLPLIIDADPQATASSWSDWRGHEPPEVIDSAPGRIAAKVEQAKKEGASLIIIDTPPHADVTATRAIEVADLVLVPCRPSAFDLAAIKTTARLVQLLGKPAFVVFTAGPPNAPRIYADATALLAEYGLPVASARIPERAIYRHACAMGNTVFDLSNNGPAQTELEMLWSWVCATVSMSTCAHVKEAAQ